jgi:hypothetical protein
MRRKRKKKNDYGQMYVVMNQHNEVFYGMHNGGEFQWTANWYDAKPLEYSNTSSIRMFHSKVELIKVEDFY